MQLRKILVTIFCSFFLIGAPAQELYVYSEPASNLPARSMSYKLKNQFVKEDKIYGRFAYRYTPQVMAGITKNFMIRVATSIGNMQTRRVRLESMQLYAKYRILSIDDIHSHFRLAAFGQLAATSVPFHYDEIDLGGDKSGVEAGVVATQLWHKFALSGTLSHIQVLHASRKNRQVYIPERYYNAMQFSLSAGYLLLPRVYSSYKQTNFNLYTELIAQRSLDNNRYYVDIAPALQLIFASATKLNFGYRHQVGTNMHRMTNSSWLLSVETTILNAFKKRSK
jgi:hypothetical protein